MPVKVNVKRFSRSKVIEEPTQEINEPVIIEPEHKTII